MGTVRTESLGTIPLVLGAIGLLASCASSLPPAPGEKIDASFAQAGGAFEAGTTIVAVAKLRQDNGKVAVCGAWLGTQNLVSSGTFTQDVLAGFSLRAGGETIVSDFNRFPQIPYKNSAIGATASCFATDIAWRPEFNAQPDFKILGFRRQSGDAAGVPVVFKRQEVENVLD